MQGAGRVIAIDNVPERLAMAGAAKAEIIDFSKEDVYERLMEMTKGRGPDRVVDAVGCEASAHGSFDAALDAAVRLFSRGIECARLGRLSLSFLDRNRPGDGQEDRRADGQHAAARA